MACLVGRLFIAALLLPAGLQKLMHFSKFAASVASKGLPFPKLWAMLDVAIEVLGPIALIYRFVAALDGAGPGRPNCRDNLGDIPVRGVHGPISSASARATDEEPRRNCGALVLLREWAWGVEPNEPAAKLGRIGGELLAFSSGRHADQLPWC